VALLVGQPTREMTVLPLSSSSSHSLFFLLDLQTTFTTTSLNLVTIGMQLSLPTKQKGKFEGKNL